MQADAELKTEEEFNQKMAMDVLDEASVEDLDLYFIEAEDIEKKGNEEELDEGEFNDFFVTKEFISEEDLEEMRLAKERQERADEILEKSTQFKPLTHRDGDYRDPQASSYGGFQLLDKAILSKLRSAGKEIAKTAGKKILSGQFNLTQISFPIKCMCPTS